jgi:hypothetical protein
MRSAVQAVKDKEMGFLKAVKTFNVPMSTLLDYVKSANSEERLSSSIGRKCALGNELQIELAKYCQIMDERFFGLKRQDIRVLAYQLDVKNNIKHPISRCKGMAGKKWLKNFMRRHQQLAFRTPELVS